jgi:predicted Rossmann fold nucleotide-binding protein DprA/Smf involved in DNA uptake
MPEFAAGVMTFTADAAEYPERLRRAATTTGVHTVESIGNLGILLSPLLGFFCSSRCPSSIILRAYDLACALRDNGIPVISGFHSPIERECLPLLLRGQQPIVFCAARSLTHLRVPAGWRQPLADGRLLITSPITGDIHRPTAAYAAARNYFAATIASAVLIAHAAPSSKIQRLSVALIQRQQPLLTLDDPANRDLITHGTHPITTDTIAAWWAQHTPGAPSESGPPSPRREGG